MNRQQRSMVLVLVGVLLAACTATTTPTATPAPPTSTPNLGPVLAPSLAPLLGANAPTMPVFPQNTPAAPIAPSIANADDADVLDVTVSGEPGAYRFSVTIASPDTGCDQYADWWEVLDEQGNLLYRRVLLHSHVDEQPFTRAGGPVPIAADTVVLVRAHMNSGGYGGQVLRGSPAGGFAAVELVPDFAPELADQPPLPESCAF